MGKPFIIALILIFSYVANGQSSPNNEDLCAAFQQHLGDYKMNTLRYTRDFRKINMAEILASYSVLIGMLKLEYHDGYISKVKLLPFLKKRKPLLDLHFLNIESNLEAFYWKIRFMELAGDIDIAQKAEKIFYTYLNNEINILSFKK